MTASEHWWDRVAPLNNGAQVESGSDMLMAALSLGFGIWAAFQPPWQITARLPIPMGVLNAMLILGGIWLGLCGANVFPARKK